MTVSSASEFEAILSRLLIKLDKKVVELGETDDLNRARRELNDVLSLSRKPAQLKERRSALEATTDFVQVQLPNDEDALNFLWDLVDYVDYQI